MLAALVFSLALASPPHGADRETALSEVLGAASTGDRAGLDRALAKAQLAFGRDATPIFNGLADMLFDPDDEVRWCTLYAYSVLASVDLPARHAQRIAGVLANDKAPAVRLMAAKALRRWAESPWANEPPDQVPPPARRPRIPRLKSAPAVPALARALDDKNANIPAEAAAALGALAAPGAGAALRKGLAAKDPLTRAACAAALPDAVDPKAAKALRPLLKDPADGVRYAAARSLLGLGDDAAKPYVEGLVKSGRPESRLDAVQLAALSRAAWSGKLLAGRLLDDDPKVRVAAAGALADHGDRAGVVWLVTHAPRAGTDEQIDIETQLARLHVSDAERKAILAGRP